MKQSSQFIILSLFSIIFFGLHDLIAKNMQIQQDDMIVLKLPLHAIILNSDYTVSDQLDAMESVLENNNVNINARDRDGRTALNLAVYLKKDIKIIEFLINHGAKINEPDMFNQTPLHDAIKFGSIPVAKMLIYHQADKTYKNDHGQTPIDLARTDNAKDLLGL